MRPSTRSALLHGRDLFDRGEFFEAHDAWEAAWLDEAGPVRLLLQGLIQVAAAFHKISREEHPRGAVRLFDAGLEKLARNSDEVAGLRLAEFIDAVRVSREAASRWAAGDSPPPLRATFPKLEPAPTPRARKRTRGKPRVGS